MNLMTMKMSCVDPVLLFDKYDMFAVLDMFRRDAAQLVQKINPNVLLNSQIEDVVADIAAKCEFNVPVLHRDQANVRHRQVQVHEGTLVELHVPFTGDWGFFYVKPPTFDLNPPRAAVDENQIFVRVLAQNLTQQAVKQQQESILDAIDRYLSCQKGLAIDFKDSFPDFILSAVEQRKNRLLADPLGRLTTNSPCARRYRKRPYHR